jgi:hypothetical protein
MRCIACNAVLTDFEATRKGANTGDYIDMCERCFSTIKDDIDVIERKDLLEDGYEDEIEE